MITPIWLTKKRQEKLIKMASEVFPEYKFIHFLDHTRDSLKTGRLLAFSRNKDRIVTICWVEFMIYHLIPKIWEIDYQQTDHTFMVTSQYIWMKDKHPIDYLYEEFKKLK